MANGASHQLGYESRNGPRMHEVLPPSKFLFWSFPLPIFRKHEKPFVVCQLCVFWFCFGLSERTTVENACCPSFAVARPKANKWFFCREHVCIHLRSHRSKRGNITNPLYKKQQKQSACFFFCYCFQTPKHILGHENIYCFIFSQASELQPVFFIISELNTAANMFAST